MTSYVILANPGHNRIYFESAITTAELELSAIMSRFNLEPQFTACKIEGMPHNICFETKTEIDDEALKYIAASSVCYAMFKIEVGGLLKPIKLPSFQIFDDSINTILRYKGKTNEQFTRLMLNLALVACKTKSSRKKLLDPMCGKGTTLYEGLSRGMDVIGVETNSTWFSEMTTYIVKYLQMGKFKHKATKSKRTINGKKTADEMTVITAPTKADFDAKNTYSFEVFHSDTRICDTLIKKNSCDIIVSDLPYGVQHASKSKNGATEELCRSPYSLLEEALPAWKAVLKQGGAIALSFNEYTLHYNDVANLLEKNGFHVLREKPFYGYQHRVDQSIVRDIVVAYA